MNFRRIARWMGWSTAVLVVACAALVWSAIRDARKRFHGDRKVLAEALGESPDGADLDAQLRKLLAEHPEQVLPLFESSDPTVRAAAFRRSALLPDLSGAQSARIAEIFAQTPPHERRAWMESYQFRVRWPALLSRLESATAVDPELGADLAYSFARHSYVVPIERLRTLALNSDFAPANRSWALTALGLAGKSAESTTPTIESLAQDPAVPVALAARIALARIRNTPDPDRLRAELADARSRFPRELREPLALIASFGAAAHQLGPEVLKELRPLDHDQGASAAVTLMAIGYREAIPQLITAAQNDDDWRLAEFACEALGRLGANETAPMLQNLAEKHFDSRVRAAAREALAALREGYRYPPARLAWHEFLWTRRDRFRDPPGPRNDAIDAEYYADTHPTDWDLIFWFPLSQRFHPRVTRVKAHVFGGTIEERFNLQARHSMRFAGGTLLGYDEGEFGSGLVFVPRRGIPEYFPLPNVTQFVRRNDGVLIMTCEAMSTDGMIYLARQTPDGEVSITPYKRTDIGFWRARVERDGSLNFYDWVRLKPEGHFERVQ